MPAESADRAQQPHEISVVIPVYKGELSLPNLMTEVAPFTQVTTSEGGAHWIITEVLLVFDNGPDGSARVIRELEAQYDFVRGVWLSRNFGQHHATLAGMASTGSEWIATIDEDGQHDPRDIGALLDAAIAAHAPVVYAKPTNKPPHGFLRNAASRGAKALVARLSSSRDAPDYQSFRLMLGEIGRSVAAYAGSGVYLDVAVGWVASSSTTAPVAFREEADRASGYSGRKLLGHFWRLVLSSGTKALRMVSVLGVVFALAGIGLAIFFVIERLLGGDLPQGWTTIVTIVLISSGAILFSLGVIAEFLGVAVNMAMGRPPYLIVSDPGRGPLDRRNTPQ